MPAPSDLGDLDPLIHVWKRAFPLLRCHDSRFGATEFNPGLGNGRFHPLTTVGGGNVPTLYGSDTFDGALSETVFHNVPIRGPGRGVRQETLRTLMVSTLAPARDLRLGQLHGYGLRRMRLSRNELIGSEAAHYAETRAWGEALHRCAAEVDGLVWVSRQHDTSFAMVLFGDRLRRDELDVIEPPLPVAWGPGLDRLFQAADKADILVMM